MRLHTGVWSPNRSYTWVFGLPTAATHWCLDSQPRLHTGVWIPNCGYTQVFGVPTAAAHGYLEFRRGVQVATFFTTTLSKRNILSSSILCANLDFKSCRRCPTKRRKICLPRGRCKNRCRVDLMSGTLTGLCTPSLQRLLHRLGLIPLGDKSLTAHPNR